MGICSSGEPRAGDPSPTVDINDDPIADLVRPDGRVDRRAPAGIVVWISAGLGTESATTAPNGQGDRGDRKASGPK